MTTLSDALAHFPVFADVPAAERLLIAQGAQRVSYREGDRLFTEGHAAHGCWLVETGTVALDFSVPGRGRVVVQTVSSGDIVGLSWLVPNGRWQFGAVALEPTTTIVLDTDGLVSLAKADPRFGYMLTTSMFVELVHRLNSTRARLLDVYRSPREQH
ncbi:Crp/Fnr family transcriptional regulator [Smaragdicoccus niigatensis]|uniref:Crp/Fnr family transcriptional regulator n=1 Tax=Smaragdicoccus niigatensis TaxID=359359 RepID=UPI0003738BA9|nr:cyclic nucleotide-binding domain-containing protein [Smaragdicoccus niigatensis]